MRNRAESGSGRAPTTTLEKVATSGERIRSAALRIFDALWDEAKPSPEAPAPTPRAFGAGSVTPYPSFR